MWQDWWENGDLKPNVAYPHSDTSGESLGMNHAQYIKLRAAWIRVAPPIPTVKWVTIGSTDYSMWNEWTIGKARYIDRDNGNGVFVEGSFIPQSRLDYTVGAMALPKLWAGPGWNTGLSGERAAGQPLRDRLGLRGQAGEPAHRRPAAPGDRHLDPGLGGGPLQPLPHRPARRSALRHGGVSDHSAKLGDPLPRPERHARSVLHARPGRTCFPSRCWGRTRATT